MDIPPAAESQPFLGHEVTAPNSALTEAFPLDVMDLSKDASRRVIIAQGTEDLYHGHPTTLLMPDGKTIFCAWTLNHGGPCGPLARSDDGGLSWKRVENLPANWETTRNCPTLFRLQDPAGKWRLFVFAGQGPDECIHRAYSEDDGKTWSSMKTVGLKGVMPFCSILPIEGGKRLLGVTNIRRSDTEAPNVRSNILAQSYSDDGGFSWSSWRVILDKADHKFCEPWVVVSPDGKEWTCLIRENLHPVSSYITSRDEGRTWSAARPLPVGLTGDRHIARYAKDGRLVVVFRDRALQSGTTSHFVAWVGTYDELTAFPARGYRIKLLHSYNAYDCGYPGLECLPDGTFVATTYIKYRPGAEKNSLVSVRFSLEEVDKCRSKK